MNEQDYCTRELHVAFPPGRVCYCGALVFFGTPCEHDYHMSLESAFLWVCAKCGDVR